MTQMYAVLLLVLVLMNLVLGNTILAEGSPQPPPLTKYLHCSQCLLETKELGRLLELDIYLAPLGSSCVTLYIKNSPELHCVAQASLELVIHLPPFPEGCDHRSAPESLARTMLLIINRAFGYSINASWISATTQQEEDYALGQQEPLRCPATLQISI